MAVHVRPSDAQTIASQKVFDIVMFTRPFRLAALAAVTTVTAALTIAFPAMNSSAANPGGATNFDIAPGGTLTIDLVAACGGGPFEEADYAIEATSGGMTGTINGASLNANHSGPAANPGDSLGTITVALSHPMIGWLGDCGLGFYQPDTAPPPTTAPTTSTTTTTTTTTTAPTTTAPPTTTVPPVVPQLIQDTFTTPEDTALDVDLATNLTGTWTFSTVGSLTGSGPGTGWAVSPTGNMTWTPPADTSGTWNGTVQVTDTTDPGTFHQFPITIHVTDVNDPVALVSDTVDVTWDGTNDLTYLPENLIAAFGAWDPDGGPSETGGAPEIQSIDPVLPGVGYASFYSAIDLMWHIRGTANHGDVTQFTVAFYSAGSTANGTLRVETVLPYQPPSLVRNTFTVEEDTELTASLELDNVTGWTWDTISTPAPDNDWDLTAAGQITWTPPANDHGTYTATVRATDPNNTSRSETYTLTLTVTPVDDPLTIGTTRVTDSLYADDGYDTVLFDDQLAERFDVVDVDDAVHVINAYVIDGGGTVTVDTGRVTFTAATGHQEETEYEIQFQSGALVISGRYVLTTIEPLTVTSDDIDLRTHDGGAAPSTGTITVTGGNRPLTFTVTEGPDYGTLFVDATGTWTYTPPTYTSGFDWEDYDGDSMYIEINVTDGTVDEDVVMYVRVDHQNRPPTVERTEATVEVRGRDAIHEFDADELAELFGVADPENDDFEKAAGSNGDNLKVRNRSRSVEVRFDDPDKPGTVDITLATETGDPVDRTPPLTLTVIQTNDLPVLGEITAEPVAASDFPTWDVTFDVSDPNGDDIEMVVNSTDLDDDNVTITDDPTVRRLVVSSNDQTHPPTAAMTVTVSDGTDSFQVTRTVTLPSYADTTREFRMRVVRPTEPLCFERPCEAQTLSNEGFEAAVREVLGTPTPVTFISVDSGGPVPGFAQLTESAQGGPTVYTAEIPFGATSLTVTMSGYEPRTYELDPTITELEYTPTAGGELSGIATTDNGTPAASTGLVFRRLGDDDAAGTADDTIIELTTAADGSYLIEGIQTGTWVIETVDGARLTTIDVASGANSINVTVPATPTPSPTGTLPATGIDPGMLAAIAALLVVAGVAALAATRRTRQRTL